MKHRNLVTSCHRPSGKRLSTPFLMAACLLWTNGIDAQAAPISLRFEAKIGQLPLFNDDIGLPFDLTQGDVLKGLMSIDPNLAGTTYGNSATHTQPCAIQLAHDGHTFGTTTFTTLVINDSIIVDGPNSGSADFITFECSSGKSVLCSPGFVSFPSSPQLMLGIGIQLSGASSLLQAPTLPVDTHVLNEFTIQRSMRVSFSTTTGEGAIYDATLSSFVVVPEPATSGILIVIFSWYIFLNRR